MLSGQLLLLVFGHVLMLMFCELCDKTTAKPPLSALNHIYALCLCVQRLDQVRLQLAQLADERAAASDLNAASFDRKGKTAIKMAMQSDSALFCRRSSKSKRMSAAYGRCSKRDSSSCKKRKPVRFYCCSHSLLTPPLLCSRCRANRACEFAARCEAAASRIQVHFL